MYSGITQQTISQIIEQCLLLYLPNFDCLMYIKYTAACLHIGFGCEDYVIESVDLAPSQFLDASGKILDLGYYLILINKI